MIGCSSDRQDKRVGTGSIVALIRRSVSTGAVVLLAVAGLVRPAAGQAPIKAVVPVSMPAWSKGIQRLTRDSYYHAIECGKQGGAQPSCVFYDAALCKNDDFVLSFYSPY